MKKFYSVLLAMVVSSIGFAANVEMTTTGPSGQGDLVFAAKSTGTTNMRMTTTGIKDVTFQAGAIAGSALAAGAVTADKIASSVVTNVLAAGMVLPAVDGSGVTNLSAAQLNAGTVLPALTATALTGLAGGNIASGNIAIARLTNAIPTAAALALNNGAGLTNLAAATAFPGYAVVVLTNKSDIGVGYTNIITFIGTVSGTLAP